jgi:hypothetical protein
MKHSKPLIVSLLSCSLGLSGSLIATKNAFGEGEVEIKGDPSTVNKTLVTPTVEVHFLYSVDGKEGSFQELPNGMALRSGQLYRIEFTPREDCHITVYQVDSTGKPDFLRKSALVKANTTYVLPATGKAYFLDKKKGKETIYFKACYKACPDDEPRGKVEHKGRGGEVDVPSQTGCQGSCVKSVTFEHVD